MKKYLANIAWSICCVVMAALALGGCGKSNARNLKYLVVQMEEGSSWSIIDKDGNVVVEEEYPASSVISDIYEGVYWVKSGNKYQLFSIDNPKKPLVDEEFDDVADFKDYDLTFVSVHNKPIRIINTKGKTVATLPKSVKRCYSFSKEGYALYMDKNEKWGVMNDKGKTIVKPTYAATGLLNEGVFLAVKKLEDSKALILNIRGKKVGEINGSKYEMVSVRMAEGKIIVKDADTEHPKFYALNTKGEKLFTIKKAVDTSSEYVDGYIVIKDENDKYGLVNDKGEMAIRPKYTRLVNLGEDFFVAQKDGKMGIINSKDETIVDFDYNDALKEKFDGRFIMKDGNEWVVIDKDKKEYATFISFTGEGDLYVDFTEDTPMEEAPDYGDPGMEEDMEGYGANGLMFALPEGTTKYTGKMNGYPIEFTIVNKPSTGELYADYKNVNYGTTMKMVGESLPAQDGAITFTGEENGHNWCFELDGDADHITGTASGNNHLFNVELKRK